MQNDKNIGYAGGNNRGIQKIIKEGKSKYVVILNNDVKVEKGWLRNLLKGFNQDDIGICTSKILLYYKYNPIKIVPQEAVTLTNVMISDLEYHPLIFKNGIDEKGELLKLPLNLKKGNVYDIAVPYKDEREYLLKLAFKQGEVKVFNGDQRLIFRGGGEKKIQIRGDYVFQNAGTLFHRDRIVFEDRYLFRFVPQTV